MVWLGRAEVPDSLRPASDVTKTAVPPKRSPTIVALAARHSDRCSPPKLRHRYPCRDGGPVGALSAELARAAFSPRPRPDRRREQLHGSSRVWPRRVRALEAAARADHRRADLLFSDAIPRDRRRSGFAPTVAPRWRDPVLQRRPRCRITQPLTAGVASSGLLTYTRSRRAVEGCCAQHRITRPRNSRHFSNPRRLCTPSSPSALPQHGLRDQLCTAWPWEAASRLTAAPHSIQ